MTKPAKTLPIIRWPDGSTSTLRKIGRMWTYHVPATDTDPGGEHGSSDMVGVRDVAKSRGGHVERIPNPHYDAQLRAWHNRELRRMFAPYFRF